MEEEILRFNRLLFRFEGNYKGWGYKERGGGGGIERGKGRIVMGEVKGRRGDWFGC